MKESNQIAFKEWASVVEALGRGDQILILRKGGIHEKGKKFEVTHPEFFLFPTFEHQNPKDLKPSGEGILKRVLMEKPPSDLLPIRYYGTIEESFWVSDEKLLRGLDPFHIWSWGCLKARYDWGEEKGLFGILLRIYAFPEAVPLENLTRYGGCRSWVELEKPLATGSLKPVLPDPLFQQKKEAVHPILKDFLTPLS